ncbi:MAG TPA: peptidase MA family metallohydrolase [Candidatus Limnocylindrales bacterium]|nr:peptidase MA family metallohydrolase [Candidatus Limnocylindrales bacterium]
MRVLATGVRRLATAVAVVGLIAGAIVPPVALAADPVTFGRPSASSTFGGFIEFTQPVGDRTAPKRAELLLSTPGAPGPTVIPSDTNAGTVELRYRLDLSDGHIVPNTTFTARWRVVDATGKVWMSPEVRHTYDDDRAPWTTIEGDIVRVHWQEGSRAFGERALKIGSDAVAETAALLGVTETEPIDFFIYGDEATFRGALGPATRENVGGQAHPSIRTLFALITPGEIDASWVESVVPHELTHLVFATAVDNPYHDPPHWLNEGLAVYLADGYDADNRAQVRAAARAGSIIPLDGLAGAFPTTRDRFFLAYAESVSAVDRIVRVNGREALIKLIRSYADGVSDDDAFRAALGQDVAGFEADWLAELGARSPIRRGPQPAPVGPLPEGWSGPLPDPSFEVTGSLPPAAPGVPLPGGGGGDDPLARFLMPSLSLVGVALVLVVVAVSVRRARRRTDPVAWAIQGDNRLFGRPPTPDPEDPDDPDDPDESGGAMEPRGAGEPGGEGTSDPDRRLRPRGPGS